jgi:hypothetical protein
MISVGYPVIKKGPFEWLVGLAGRSKSDVEVYVYPEPMLGIFLGEKSINKECSSNRAISSEYKEVPSR